MARLRTVLPRWLSIRLTDSEIVRTLLEIHLKVEKLVKKGILVLRGHWLG